MKLGLFASLPMPVDLRGVLLFASDMEVPQARQTRRHEDHVRPVRISAYCLPSSNKDGAQPLFQNRTLNVLCMLGVLKLLWYLVSEQRTITPTACLLHFSLLFIGGKPKALLHIFPDLLEVLLTWDDWQMEQVGSKGAVPEPQWREKALLQVCGPKFIMCSSNSGFENLCSYWTFLKCVF